MNPHDYMLRFQNKLNQIFDLEGKSGGIGNSDLRVSTSIKLKDQVSEIHNDQIADENALEMVQIIKNEKSINPMIRN